MSAKKTVSFDAVISTCVGIQRDDTNPILSILDLDHDALNKFMRVSLSKIKGESTRLWDNYYLSIIASYSTLIFIFSGTKNAGLVDYKASEYNAKWQAILDAYSANEIDEDFNELICEIWPWIPPPDGEWRLSQIVDLISSSIWHNKCDELEPTKHELFGNMVAMVRDR